MNEFKKNWLGWVMTLAIALTVQYYVLSKNISYQTSQKTQEELIRLDKEKASKVDLQEEERLRIEGDKAQSKELQQAMKELRQVLDDNNDKQTDRIINLLNKRYIK